MDYGLREHLNSSKLPHQNTHFTYCSSYPCTLRQHRILKAWFPLEGSLNVIKPEKRDEPDIPTEGHHKYTSLIPGYIDLLVTHQIFTHKGVQSPWRVIYEGKGSEGESLDGAFTQLQKYGTDGMPPGTVCFAIAAKGTTCRFWRFFRRPNEERIKLQSLGLGTSQDSDDVVIVPEGQHGPVYDLQRQEHLIAHILEYIHTQTSRRSG